MSVVLNRNLRQNTVMKALMKTFTYNVFMLEELVKDNISLYMIVYYEKFSEMDQNLNYET